MAATASMYPTTVASTVGTTWASTTNATGSPAGGALATFTNTTSGGSGTIQLSGYAAQTNTNSGVTPLSINSIDVTVANFVGTTGRTASITVQLFAGTTAIGAATSLTISATSSNAQTVNLSGANCPTWDQMLDLRAQVVFTRTAVTTANVFSLDYVGVVVNYTSATVSPAFGSVSTTMTWPATFMVVPVPSGVTDGDQLLLFTMSSTPTDPDALAGWTVLEDQISIYIGGTLWARTASSEPANYTVGFSGGATCASGIMIRYTNVSGIGSHNQVTTSGPGPYSATSPTPTAPAGLAATDLVVRCYGIVCEVPDSTGTGPAITFTAPSAPWNNRASASSTNPNNYQAAGLIVDAVGSTAVPTALSSDSSTAWDVFSVALQGVTVPNAAPFVVGQAVNRASTF